MLRLAFCGWRMRRRLPWPPAVLLRVVRAWRWHRLQVVLRSIRIDYARSRCERRERRLLAAATFLWRKAVIWLVLWRYHRGAVIRSLARRFRVHDQRLLLVAFRHWSAVLATFWGPQRWQQLEAQEVRRPGFPFLR